MHQVSHSTASFVVDPMHKDKPLLSVRIKLTRDQFVNANVYKDDSA